MADAANTLYPGGPSSILGNEALMHPQRDDAGHKFIDNIPNAKGLFGPIKEDMAGPMKEYADKAAAMTKHMVDLYKSGDPDVRSVVRDFEKKTKVPKGYLSTDTMSEGSMWEAFMSHYGNLMNDAAEREDISPTEKTALLERGHFDRGGKAMNMGRINAKLSAQYPGPGI